jgi:hypothetical protein
MRNFAVVKDKLVLTRSQPAREERAEEAAAA